MTACDCGCYSGGCDRPEGCRCGPDCPCLLRECDKVVAVLGDDNVYPCALERGHSGRCQPDYEA